MIQMMIHTLPVIIEERNDSAKSDEICQGKVDGCVQYLQQRYIIRITPFVVIAEE